MPDDTHDGIDCLLKEIWINQKCNALPAFYATDNVAKDRYMVADSFAEIRQARQTLGLTTEPVTEIHQDVFHARERVARTLNKSHSDYSNAMAALKRVFGRSTSDTLLRSTLKHSCTTRHRKAPTRCSDSRVRGYSFRDSRVEGRQSTDFGRGTFGLAEAC